MLIGKAMVAAATAAKSLQSCPTLCDPIDSSLPGSPVPGILQARTLEWLGTYKKDNEKSLLTGSEKHASFTFPTASLHFNSPAMITVKTYFTYLRTF